MRKILVVEDRDSTVLQLKRSLEQQGYEVYIARRGREALDIVSQQHIDLVLLDLLLPDISGLFICKELRDRYPRLPVIIISVKTDLQNKVQALNTCADDYIAKPFYMKEVLARINVQFLHAEHMRAGAEKQSFIAGPLTINFEQRRVTVKGQEIDLTYTEYKLLYVLVNNSGRIVTYDFILSNVWGDDEASEREYIHVYINRLRKKIETPAQRRFIYNEPKVGYRFQVDD
jgi:two-component system KDP operon response regulator KdpE